MALDRSWYNSLVDDDGSGLTGSVWDKADVDALMDAIDAEIARIDAARLQYTEGSWSPSFLGSGGQSGQTYGTRAGSYFRFGSRIDITGYMQLSTLGTFSGNIRLGIPTPMVGLGSEYYAGHIPWWINFAATTWLWLGVYLGPAEPNALLSGNAVAAFTIGAAGSLTQANLTATAGLIFSLGYRCNPTAVISGTFLAPGMARAEGLSAPSRLRALTKALHCAVLTEFDKRAIRRRLAGSCAPAAVRLGY